MENIEYYTILKIDKKASEEEIWLNYHKLVFLEESKKSPNTQYLTKLAEAYEHMKDPVLRKEYERENYLHIPLKIRTSIAIFLTGFWAEVAWYLLTHMGFK